MKGPGTNLGNTYSWELEKEGGATWGTEDKWPPRWRRVRKASLTERSRRWTHALLHQGVGWIEIQPIYP